MHNLTRLLRDGSLTWRKICFRTWQSSAIRETKLCALPSNGRILHRIDWRNKWCSVCLLSIRDKDLSFQFMRSWKKNNRSCRLGVGLKKVDASWPTEQVDELLVNGSIGVLPTCNFGVGTRWWKRSCTVSSSRKHNKQIVQVFAILRLDLLYSFGRRSYPSYVKGWTNVIQGFLRLCNLHISRQQKRIWSDYHKTREETRRKG